MNVVSIVHREEPPGLSFGIPCSNSCAGTWIPRLTAPKSSPQDSRNGISVLGPAL